MVTVRQCFKIGDKKINKYVTITATMNAEAVVLPVANENENEEEVNEDLNEAADEEDDDEDEEQTEDEELYDAALAGNLERVMLLVEQGDDKNQHGGEFGQQEMSLNL